MPSAKPTNGELAVMIQSLTDRVSMDNTHFKEKLGSIEAKQDHTNGRVRKLEQWKFIVIGGGILINIILVPVIVAYLISKFVN